MWLSTAASTSFKAQDGRYAGCPERSVKGTEEQEAVEARAIVVAHLRGSIAEFEVEGTRGPHRSPLSEVDQLPTANTPKPDEAGRHHFPAGA